MCVCCVCVSERERGCVCVCVWERWGGGGGGVENKQKSLVWKKKKKKNPALEHTLQNNLLSQLMTKCNQPNSKDIVHTTQITLSLGPKARADLKQATRGGAHLSAQIKRNYWTNVDGTAATATAPPEVTLQGYTMILQQHHITFVIVTESENMEYWTTKILTVCVHYGLWHHSLGVCRGCKHVTDWCQYSYRSINRSALNLWHSLRLIWIYDTVCGSDWNLWHDLQGSVPFVRPV